MAWSVAQHAVPVNPILKGRVEERGKPKHISRVHFGLFSGPEIMKVAHINVCNRELYQMPTRNPTRHGCLDRRLGVSEKVTGAGTKPLCETCGKGLKHCAGHFGYIKLELPVFHIGFFKATINILQNICKTCSRVLLSDADLAKYTKRMRNPDMGALRKVKERKVITAECRKVRLCMHCGAFNGTVKKVPGAQSLKIIHEKFKGSKSDAARSDFLELFENAITKNADLTAHLSRAHDDLNPIRVRELFCAIRDEELDVLWTSPDHGRPENMIVTHLLVPPVCIRPSVAMEAGSGSNEDDLTLKLKEVVYINNSLRVALLNGTRMKTIMEDWDFLQVQVAAYINGELPGLPPAARPKKPIRGLCQRLKGKQGRFRGNLLGKRVDFSARSVISPDPNLRLEQVGVPQRMAKILTFPERVNSSNIERLRANVRNGPTYPGANAIIANSTNFTSSLKFGNLKEKAEKLQVGDIVERHLRDGDVVLFNRQPSLHKMSIMAHRAKVMPSRTLRFNECVCAPYNADFDGDEMNLHLPQTMEARAEAGTLMDVRYNMITPRCGQPLISACQDFLTASYLLTQRNIFLTRDQFCNVVTSAQDGLHRVDLPPPAIFAPIQLWTGKQVVSVLLRPRRDDDIKVNLELKERNYMGTDPSGKEYLHMCPAEGYVCFRNSELMCGNLCKSTLGGNKNGLIYALIRDHSPVFAAEFMHRMTKVFPRWLTEYGFSIGIEDVTPSELLTAKKQDLIDEGYDACDHNIEQFKLGKLQLQPGCDAEQSLEAVLNGILGKLRDKVGKMSVTQLPFHNAPRIMATCGSKGSTLNICQMVACVGQQQVSGARVPEGFVHRTLPIFKVNAKEPAAKGFVANSFFTGLTATEFFFHTMGGREGLVDTAVKTAETGYMQRRLMKVLEDLSVQYDDTVRTSKLNVVQFEYGGDGLDPSLMEPNKRPVEFKRLTANTLAQHPCRGENMLSPDELIAMVEERLATPGYQELLPRGKRFHGEVRAHFTALAESMREVCVDVLGGDATYIASMPMSRPTIDGGASGAGGGAGAGAATSGSRVSGQLRDWQGSATKTATQAWLEEAALAVWNTHRLTVSQVDKLLTRALTMYNRAIIEPGEAVGALGAHSLGEPATQMTLKTFHFAGVASMNVTLGVPRIKEIINASASISTPIIECQLERPGELLSARFAKARIEKTTLGEIAQRIEETYSNERCFLAVHLDLDLLEKLHLEVTAHSAQAAIINTSSLKLAPSNVSVASDSCIIITPPEKGYRQRGAPKRETMRGEQYFSLQTLKNLVPDVVVQGLPSVSRAVITQMSATDVEQYVPDAVKDKSYYRLVVEGYNYLGVMGTPGVKATQSVSNHIKEVEATLGIEAARVMIMKEVLKTYSNYGIDIDDRHLMLLSDVMTYRGEVLGITRFGIAKMKDSVLMLASFEKTPDHLFDAAVHSRRDDISGVSECIIMGTPIPLGTGLFKLVHKPQVEEARKKQPPLLLHL